jgi:Cu/Ag efflux protein CusF
VKRGLLAGLLIAGLASCSRPGPAPADAGQPNTARVTGTVIGVDPPNGTITLQQGPIAAWGWPAMRMAMKAPPAAIAQARVGDRISADLRLAGGSAEITAIARP